MSPQNKISFSKIFLGLFFLGLFFVVAPAAVRAASYDVTGDAWSSNIGWIKFNHGKSNAVKYDDSTGKLSGYAWSSNIGWISFGETSKPLSASGDVGGTSATANTSTGLISGWARACAGTQSGTCSSMTSRTDGWDGWIKFDTGKSNPVKIDLNNSNSTYGDFTGYAWGSDVVGWVSFSGSNYKVEVGLPTSTSTTPTCSDGIQNQDETGVDTGGVCGTTTYKCVSNACVSVNDSGGTYPTQSACDSACGGGGGGKTYTLTVNVDGTGTGSVSDGGSNTCSSSGSTATCYWDYDENTAVTLTATKGTDSEFSGWSGSGGCSGTGNCSLTINSDKEATATFSCSGSNCNVDEETEVPAGGGGGGGDDGDGSDGDDGDGSDGDDGSDGGEIISGDDDDSSGDNGTFSLSFVPDKLYATVLDGLPADSSSSNITVTTSGTCKDISLLATIPTISKANPTISINSNGTYKITVKSIPGTTTTGDYPVVVAGTGTNCDNTSDDVTLNVENLTTRWEEI